MGNKHFSWYIISNVLLEATQTLAEIKHCHPDFGADKNSN